MSNDLSTLDDDVAAILREVRDAPNPNAVDNADALLAALSEEVNSLPLNRIPGFIGAVVLQAEAVNTLLREPGDEERQGERVVDFLRGAVAAARLFESVTGDSGLGDRLEALLAFIASGGGAPSIAEAAADVRSQIAAHKVQEAADKAVSGIGIGAGGVVVEINGEPQGADVDPDESENPED